MKTKLNINLDRELLQSFAEACIGLIGLTVIIRIVGFFAEAIIPIYVVLRNITMMVAFFPLCVLGLILVYYMVGGITINNKEFNG